MNDQVQKPEIDNLQAVLVEGERWLLSHGVVTPVTHNNIVLNLYMNFPHVKLVEYFMDTPNKTIKVFLYMNTWRALITNKENMTGDVLEVLSQYLTDFRIEVNFKRYKKSDTYKKK